ncbi:uncharacterized protein LOC121895614 isoform X2 [Thunnus maccoyii]|uniref:uncharacterized protein LOC121895614 isoform X2 n=1 Tax=Thunnus maccoyii TaxID=8240 RepID=UPI001C4C975C|nr:uncharacterized protein LOC121895614 isoform X2 [Thunnus maccoyii]
MGRSKDKTKHFARPFTLLTQREKTGALSYRRFLWPTGVALIVLQDVVAEMLFKHQIRTKLPELLLISQQVNFMTLPYGSLMLRGRRKAEWMLTEPEEQLIAKSSKFPRSPWPRQRHKHNFRNVISSMDEGGKVLAVKTTLTPPRRKHDPTHDRFLGSDEALNEDEIFIGDRWRDGWTGVREEDGVQGEKMQMHFWWK